ncbi:DUF1648 domain-containing protein [Oscillatoria acuminata]|uniref:DUF1648 domain-containing protein n=1 Tax=Oscillatoria acuminata PCC 6304 TaxID=56110 RepID=K9TG43_9CYAN|nr:DUF1648 domain-containing protein [Oscillatoria acuminata]AFY81353.1 Protein of unknown function (DUF1648) [Oscillatoria acuminata PCC 6304]
MKDPQQRPVIEAIAYSPLEIILEITALLGVVASLAIGLYYWQNLPGSVPLHFGITGEPDLWGPKLTFWLIPAIGVISYLSMTLTNFFPNTFNYPVPITPENIQNQYKIARKLLLWMKAELMGIILWIEWETIRVAMKKSPNLSIFYLLGFLGLLFLTIGFYLRQSYRDR